MSDELLLAEREEVAYYMRRLYTQKLTTTSGGNISCRVGAHMLVTPAALDKARMTGAQVAVLDDHGDLMTPDCRPSSEFQMHVHIYRRCPEVRAIVHAHPPIASAFTAAKTPINIELLAETYALLDPPLVAPYALTGTEELADKVADTAAQSCCILLENHGVTCTGKDLLQAFDRLELVESAASMTVTAKQLDGISPLTAARKQELDRLVGRS